MKMRNTLSGIAALLLVGVFYSFAFCVVEDIDDEPISMDFYYSTETDADTGKQYGKATSVNVTDSTEQIVTEAVQAVIRNETAVPEEKAQSEKTEPTEKKEAETEEAQPVQTKQEVPVNTDGSATASQQQVYADEAVSNELLSRLDSVPVVTTVPEQLTEEDDTETVFEVPDADILVDTPVGEEDNYPEYTEKAKETVKETEDDRIVVIIPEESSATASETKNFETVPSFDATGSATQTSIPETVITVTTTTSVSVPDLVINLDTTVSETSVSVPADTSSSTVAPASGEMFTVKINGSSHTMNSFDLVCQIVNNEISPYFSDEAIKAQAVAAYSYVKYHNENGLVPSVLVRSNPSQRIIDMVSSVWGKCCYYNGKTAQTVYMASSSGYTASSKNVWGGNFDYLVSVPCPFDAQSDPNYGKVVRISEDGMRSAIERYFGIKLSNNPENWLRIKSYVDGNYVSEIDIDGQTVTSGRKMRESVLGYEINSASFDVSYADGVFTFTTYGWGHGVGMSQNGANILAKQGYTYEEILKYYYTGIDVL
ncbi:MAG: SpoIID/LytB domain-containing protein [Oscillospiraceae bacterium]|nr:SpoIID/LytB domain-containing protein [Oscillospiraceae bacterium]